MVYNSASGSFDSVHLQRFAEQFEIELKPFESLHGGLEALDSHCKAVVFNERLYLENEHRRCMLATVYGRLSSD